jgi:hypothetical protein
MIEWTRITACGFDGRLADRAAEAGPATPRRLPTHGRLQPVRIARRKSPIANGSGL